MSTVGTPKSPEQIQHDWDNNPRWKGVNRSYTPEDVVALQEHVDRRNRPLAGGLIVQPIARQTAFERPLQIEQRLEWIGKSCDHVYTSLHVGGGERYWTLLARPVGF